MQPTRLSPGHLFPYFFRCVTGRQVGSNRMLTSKSSLLSECGIVVARTCSGRCPVHLHPPDHGRARSREWSLDSVTVAQFFAWPPPRWTLPEWPLMVAGQTRNLELFSFVSWFTGNRFSRRWRNFTLVEALRSVCRGDERREKRARNVGKYNFQETRD